MYFDVVLDSQSRVLFNGTTQETIQWLSKEHPTLTDPIWIIRGWDLKILEVAEYFKVTQ